MAIVPTIIPEVQDIVDNAAVRELFIIGREMERPPYWHEGEGLNARLGKALRVVQDGRITPNSDGSYTVEGSAQRTYRVTNSCSCPQSQKGKSKYCYHFVAVCLYIEWCRRVGHADQAALPLPPTTPDERLRQSVALSMVHDATALSTHHTPQEDRMSDDADAYIPEPDAAPVATLERPTPEPAHVTQAVREGHALLEEPTRVSIPAEYVMSIKGKRHVLYAGLVIGAQRSGLVSLAADWTYNDAELSLAHAVATFADGRRYEDSGDASPSNVTKGIATHFRRVALTRAKARCLRDALGIQECSVEELADETPKRDVPDMSKGTPLGQQELRQRIWAMMTAQAPQQATTREAVSAWIMQVTGYELVPEHYPAIVRILEARA